MPSRLSTFAPPVAGTLAALIIFVLSLGSYWIHYFPYEDDFSLIRYSAAQNSPAPLTWITKGFSNYFANDPLCATKSFGFDRPVANATFYLESLFYRVPEGPVLLLMNILCWILSAWWIYAIARRLGASRWLASSGMVLYALSPCWYRVLMHASFRNNGIAACCILAASYLLLGENAVRSWWRLLIAGVLVAVAAGAHEQGLTSVPVLVVGIAWLRYKADGRWRPGPTLAAILVVAVPPVLLFLSFRLMNPAYGSSYVTAGFLASVSQSNRLASFGIQNPGLIIAIKTAFRVVTALVSAMTAFTPSGFENMGRLSPYVGIIIFILTVAAATGVVRRNPTVGLPMTALILYAVGRSIGIPLAEPRFMLMEVAWGIITLVCALSAALASGKRGAMVAGGAAALGLLLFNLISYNATILSRRSILLQRNEVDREAFRRIQSAAAKYPEAQVILSNDHAGMWSGGAMLQLAGFRKLDLEILPTVIDGPSTDVVRDVLACPTATRVMRRHAVLDVQLDYPAGCSITSFGRDLACEVNRYQSAGWSHAAAWSSFLNDDLKNGRAFPPPLIQEVSLQPARPLVVIAWRDRLSIPDVSTVPAESQVSP
ncbi:MAG: hypothetical protein JOZ33_15995 [Acidobacteriaceae bacterium]|nr:hypothetical protein [Acidobacteriaceae bacterium]